MGTQRTRIGDGNPPEEQQDTETTDDLGLSEDIIPTMDDPSGFVANTPVQELAGRRVRPMTDDELQRAHNMQAGENVPMFGRGSIIQQNRENPGMMDPDPEELKRRATPRQDPATRQQAEQMMPDFMRAQATATSAPEAPKQQVRSQPQTDYVQPRAEKRTAGFTNVAMALEHLLAEEEDARARGDYIAANQARKMAERLAEGVEFERIVRPKTEHPALQKLKANLGLSVIQPTTIDWGGSKWLFAATNARIDRWVTDEMQADGTNLAALMISAGLVGIDGVPLFEVLGVPLETTYNVHEKDDDGLIVDTETITVKLYRKFCTCGTEIDVKLTKCPICGATHSVFEMPTDLRMKCAVSFYEMLENEFGPYEELAILLEEKNKIMKDRRLDKDALYPLVMSLTKRQETTA